MVNNVLELIEDELERLKEYREVLKEQGINIKDVLFKKDDRIDYAMIFGAIVVLEGLKEKLTKNGKTE